MHGPHHPLLQVDTVSMQGTEPGQQSAGWISAPPGHPAPSTSAPAWATAHQGQGIATWLDILSTIFDAPSSYLPPEEASSPILVTSSPAQMPLVPAPALRPLRPQNRTPPAPLSPPACPSGSQHWALLQVGLLGALRFCLLAPESRRQTHRDTRYQATGARPKQDTSSVQNPSPAQPKKCPEVWVPPPAPCPSPWPPT